MHIRTQTCSRIRIRQLFLLSTSYGLIELIIVSHADRPLNLWFAQWWANQKNRTYLDEGGKRKIDRNRATERASLRVGAALSLMMYITINEVDLIRPAPAPDLFIHRDFHSNKHVEKSWHARCFGAKTQNKPLVRQELWDVRCISTQHLLCSKRNSCAA